MVKRNKRRKPQAIAKPRRTGVIEPGNPGSMQITGVEVTQESFQGLLPHPDHLERYERLSPGMTKVLLDRLENQQAHRQAIEKRIVDHQLPMDKQAPWIGLSAVLSLVGLAAYLAYLGNPAYSIATVIFGIVGVLGSGAFGAHNTLRGLKRDQRQTESDLPPGTPSGDDLEIIEVDEIDHGEQ